MSVEILVPTPVTTARVAESYEQPGRPNGTLPASWLSDVASVGRMINLCPLCLGKFNPRRHHYELWRATPTVARCNRCDTWDTHCQGFIPEANHDLIGDRRLNHRSAIRRVVGRFGRWASR